MSDRLSHVDAELAEIRRTVSDLTRRLDALETDRTGRHAADDIAPTATEAVADAGARRSDTARFFVLAGRACLALGGAFVLRAVTESGFVGPQTGVWLGLAYGLAWLVLADRGPARNRLFHGWLGLGISLPLVLEAAGRFHLLAPAASLVALGLVGGLALTLAWHRRLPSLAAGASVGAVVVALALGLSTGRPLPFVALVVAFGVFALWVAYHRDWTWLAWFPAVAADLAVAVCAVRASVTPPRDSPLATEALLAVLVVAYLGSFVLRTLLHERAARLFEVAQTSAVLIVGLTGAIVVARTNAFGLVSVALPALIAGAGLYAQAYLRVVPRRGYGGDFHYFGLTAFALTLTGVTLLLSSPAQPLLTAAGSLLLALLARQYGQALLMLQAAIAATFAGVEAGLWTLAAAVWIGAGSTWPVLSVLSVLVLAATAASYVLLIAPRPGLHGGLGRAARVLLAACLASGVGSLVVFWVGPLIAGHPPDAGVLATTRTVILAAAVVILARLGRAPHRRELVWIAYAALTVGAARIVLEDLRVSEAATLFIALAAYGVALIATPRMASGPAEAPVAQPRDGVDG